MYDLIVIGGGSGGLSVSKYAVDYGAKKVAVLDFVKPSSQGSVWGLGGTCVNVGCIPKKLMHYAGGMRAMFEDSGSLGWSLEKKPEHSWESLVKAVQSYVKQLNFSYRAGLLLKDVKYINGLARIKSDHEVEYTDKLGQRFVIEGENVVIAVGGRPIIPEENEVKGAKKYCITSDDIFSLESPPGKTLIVGGSYIALECAGFLTELGYPVTVAVRSVLLRNFDRQCAEKVGDLMRALGTVMIQSTPTAVSKLKSGKLHVEFADGRVENFDTVLYAIGRRADTKDLNLEAVGIEVDSSGKIVTDACLRAGGKKNFFAIGDCARGRPELTPVAIKTGEILAKWIFRRNPQAGFIDWDCVPSTVFTPFEYAFCGLSEERAISTHGPENVEVFLHEFPSLELSASHRKKRAPPLPWGAVASCDEEDEIGPNCLAKLVCIKNEDMRVAGVHYVGLHAGEIIQGFALALKLGAKKADFDGLVGVHPTDAESFHNLWVTKRSGVSWVATGGCGGGRCG